MRELAGKTPFVTGGASGIGLALGRAFAEAGMKVMLADIEAAALAAAVPRLKDLGPDCAVLLATSPILPVSSMPPTHRSRGSETSTSCATTPVWRLPEVSKKSHSRIGDGCSTSI
jgi:hypothetical protein